MRLTKKKAKIVKSAIESWIEEEVLTEEQGEMLLKSCKEPGFDWKL
jgi:hypothetical protein